MTARHRADHVAATEQSLRGRCDTTPTAPMHDKLWVKTLLQVLVTRWLSAFERQMRRNSDAIRRNLGPRIRVSTVVGIFYPHRTRCLLPRIFFPSTPSCYIFLLLIRVPPASSALQYLALLLKILASNI
jgi:hypothetical protein